MAVKIAFASDDRQHVNQHFGVARAFVCYEVTADEARLVEVLELTQSAMDGEDGKLAARVPLLDGCAAVYCQAIGGSAIRQLSARGVQPLKVESGVAINGLLAQLKRELKEDKPPAWLAKHLKRQENHADKFDALEAEGWRE